MNVLRTLQMNADEDAYDNSWVARKQIKVV